jgi:putative acetyltransferase
MNIRTEAASEAAAIQSVHQSAFPTAAEARLVDALRDAGKLRVSLVAEVEGELVGHVAFSPVTLEGMTEGAGVGLAPLAVVPDRQRQGVGGRLVREGLAACAAGGFGFVVVLGDPAYYGRFGFAAASRWGLQDEYGGGEAFMALELLPGAIPSRGGRVRYADEFAALED